MRWLILCALLVGCSGEPAGKPAKAARTKEQRIRDAEIAVSKTPQPRTYRIDGNELLVLDFPVKTERGWLDMQRCFVWRDREFRQATLSCAPPPEMGVSPANLEP